MNVASQYDRIRAACCDITGLSPATGGVDLHAKAIAETVFLAQAQLPLSVVLEARARRLSLAMRGDGLRGEENTR